MSSQYVYLITSKNRHSESKFKIGKHTGKLSKLKSRYESYFAGDDVIILRFIKSLVYSQDEQNLLARLDEYRIIKSNGSKTEWVLLDETLLLKEFDDYFSSKHVNIDRNLLNNIIEQNNNIIDINNKLVKQIEIMNDKIKELSNDIKTNSNHIKLNSNKNIQTNVVEEIQITNQEDIKIDKDTKITKDIQIQITDINSFIKYVKIKKPEWFPFGDWIHQVLIYNKYIEMAKLSKKTITQRMFIVKTRSKLFAEKKQMRIGGENKLAIKLYKHVDIK